jgi:F-type H+-transporting ATPase subunit b
MAETTHGKTEVGHEAGHSGLFPPFDPAFYPSQILWFAITFGLFYIAVAKFIGPRLSGVVEGRRQRIADDFAAAEALKAKTEAAAAAYERDLAEARKKAGVIAADTRAKLNADVEAKRTAAEAGLSAKLGEAETRIADIKAKAMSEVDQIAADTADTIVVALSGQSAGRDEIAGAVAAAKR